MADLIQRQPGSRADARRNRALLVSADRNMFTERGVDARLDEIARRAGVGIGTLYRHFPTRESLVEAIVAERADEVLGLAETVQPDAWTGLVEFLEAMLELQRRDRVLKELFVRYPPGEGQLAETRRRLRRLFDRLLAGHEQGTLRADFGVSDLALLLWSFAPVIDATEAVPNAWKRHLHWLLDGLRQTAATPVSEPPLNDRQLKEAMRRLREQRFAQRR